MARFECTKCGSLVLVEQGAKMATCNVCGKKQRVPDTLIDGKSLEARREYDPNWEHYEKLLHMARKYKDIKVLTETAEEFDRLANYRDSREMAEFCRKRIIEEQVRLQEEAEKQRADDQQKAKVKKRNHFRMALINIGVVILIIGPNLFYNLVISPSINYEKAENLISKGRYEEAIDIFQELDGYKDSEELIAQCKDAIVERSYNNALDSMKKGYFSSAQTFFEKLGNYKDSAALAKECGYQYGLSLFNDESYLRALKAFRELGDYKDSLDLVKQSEAAYKEESYNQAVANMKAGR